jgi:hypothetical protein
LSLWGRLGCRHFGRWVNAPLNSHAGSTGTIPRGQMRNALAIEGVFAWVPDGAGDSVAKNTLQDWDDVGEADGE